MKSLPITVIAVIAIASSAVFIAGITTAILAANHVIDLSAAHAATAAYTALGGFGGIVATILFAAIAYQPSKLPSLG
jgi:hypothetical protein